MKKPIVFSLLLAIMLGVPYLFQSCSDEEIQTSSNYIGSDALLEEAKTWHQLQTNSPGFLSIMRVEQLILQPVWKEAWVYTLADGRNVIFAPAKQFELSNKEIGFQRGFLFSVDEAKITDGKIVEFYAKGGTPSDPKLWPRKYINRQMDGFSGSIIIYDLLYRRIGGSLYKSGIKTDARTSIRGKVGGSENLTHGGRVNMYCYDNYWVTTWSDGMETWDYMYTECYDDGSGGGGGGENPGGSGTTDPGYVYEAPAAEPFVGGPDPHAVPIADIDDHMKCFSTNHQAKVTIFVDQPYNGSNQPIAPPDNVGHTFLSIEQGGVTRTIGFYPQGSAHPMDPTDPSQLKDNAGKAWDVSVAFDISGEELANLLNFIQNETIGTYDLNVYNCTDWVVDAFNSMDIDLPENESSWPNGGGLCPAQFGEDLRNLNLPSRSETVSNSWETGQAPANSGSCN